MFESSPDLSVATVAEIVRLALAPVFLLSGIGAFLNVLAARLSRIVDRSRDIEPRLLASRGVEHDRWIADLRILDRRMSLINWATALSVTSAILTCLVVVLLFGDSVEVTAEVRAAAHRLHAFGGTPIGNSRVKLTNVKDCVKRGLVQPGQDPLHVAAEQLSRDGVDVLHTIGGDDTNGTAADLAAYLRGNGYSLTVVGLPKTIDNDIIPIRQTLGAWTAAEQGALYARNIIAEHSTNPRMLLVHEVMGRNCGWLTAATALAHHQWVQGANFAEWLDNSAARWDVHAIFIPERAFEIAEEAKRLRA